MPARQRRRSVNSQRHADGLDGGHLPQADLGAADDGGVTAPTPKKTSRKVAGEFTGQRRPEPGQGVCRRLRFGGPWCRSRLRVLLDFTGNVPGGMK